LRDLRGGLDAVRPSIENAGTLRHRHPRRRRIGRAAAGRRRRRDHGRRSGIPGRSGIRRWRDRAGVRRRRQRRPGLRPRQVVERIGVPLGIRREPDAEVDVRLRKLEIATRADGAHDLSFRDRVAAPHRIEPEVHERHGVPVGSEDRNGLPAAGNRARERDRARHRRRDGRAARRTDVDPAVLTGRIGMGVVE